MESDIKIQNLQGNTTDIEFILITLKKISEMLRNVKQSRHQTTQQVLKEISEILQNTADIDLIISNLDDLLEILQEKFSKDRSKQQQKKLKRNQPDLENLGNEWPSPFVARSEIGNFTKGLYKPRSMNTFDGRGTGISRRLRLGTKIFYLKEDVIEWLKKKIKS
ncbi:MAG: hypothetical protein K5766_00060 [Alphaproteobacteria bacterium]|nr:hypothetical protein [Alphaproteobacteria bacterium]